VQKSKVDLEMAMMALDKLLKSNELNFELMAVLPILAIIAILYINGAEFVKRIGNRSTNQLIHRLRLLFWYTDQCKEMLSYYAGS